MIRRARTGSLTFTDFMDLIPEDQKADLIDGVIYLASPENQAHNLLKMWLSTILNIYIEQRRLGTLFADKFAYRLSDRTAPEPDLAFVSNQRMHLVQNGFMDGAPDLAVEIISPDSVRRDYEDKRLRYEEAGVREYWIVDPAEQSALFLALADSGFVEVILEDHLFYTRVLPGLALDTRWLWQRPLPPTWPIIQRLLEGASG
jgi:Uma2 family endonuclease